MAFRSHFSATNIRYSYKRGGGDWKMRGRLGLLTPGHPGGPGMNLPKPGSHASTGPNV